MIRALASDYDGTLAWQGKVDEATLEAIRALRASGRKFILVTGRRIDDLATVFPDIKLCDVIVGENGALLYWPSNGRTEMLCPVAPQSFVRALYEKGIPPLAVGKSVIAMATSQAAEVEPLLIEQGLDLKMIFNKENMMILPAGIDKGTGLRSALSLLEINPKHTVAVGDAENDEPLLSSCGIGVAVGNALPELKAGATLFLEQNHGVGIQRLVAMIIDGSLDRYLS